MALIRTDVAGREYLRKVDWPWTWDDTGDWVRAGRPPLFLLDPGPSSLTFLRHLQPDDLLLLGTCTDDSVVLELTGLQTLTWDTGASNPVHLRDHAALTDLGIEHDRIAARDLPPGVENLAWSYPPLTDLHELGHLEHLRRLELKSARKLTALVTDPAGPLPPLVTLDVQSSSRQLDLSSCGALEPHLRHLLLQELGLVGDLAEVTALSRLQTLAYVGRSDVSDLEWVLDLPDLRQFTLAGRGRILSSDLSALDRHPMLDYIYIEPRRGYSHRFVDYIEADGQHVRERGRPRGQRSR